MVEPDYMKSPAEALALLPVWTGALRNHVSVEIGNLKFNVRRRWDSVQIQSVSHNLETARELQVAVVEKGNHSCGPQLPARISLERGLCVYTGRSQAVSGSYTDAQALIRGIVACRVEIGGKLCTLAEWLTQPLSRLEAKRNSFLTLFAQLRKRGELQQQISVGGRSLHAAYISRHCLLLSVQGGLLYGNVNFSGDISADQDGEPKPSTAIEECSLGVKEQPDVINIEIGMPSSRVSLNVSVRVYVTDFRDSIRCLALAKVKCTNIYMNERNRFTVGSDCVPVIDTTCIGTKQNSLRWRKRKEQEELIKEKVRKHIEGKTLLQVLCSPVLAAWIGNPAFTVHEPVTPIDKQRIDGLVAQLIRTAPRTSVEQEVAVDEDYGDYGDERDYEDVVDANVPDGINNVN